MENKQTFNRFSVIVLLSGLALVAIGAAWIYHPLGVIVAGVELIALTALSAKKDN
jgi:hypothetical protein